MALSCTSSTIHDEEEAITSILSGLLVAAISAGWGGACSVVWFDLWEHALSLVSLWLCTLRGGSTLSRVLQLMNIPRTKNSQHMRIRNAIRQILMSSGWGHDTERISTVRIQSNFAWFSASVWLKIPPNPSEPSTLEASDAQRSHWNARG